MARIRTTGNSNIDMATSLIALALRADNPGKPDQHYYDEAMRLRDQIIEGAGELAAKAKATQFGPPVTITILPDDRDERRELCHADVTLDGQRAKITGYCRPYANVTALPDGPSAEFAWSTVARVVANGGAFKR